MATKTITQLPAAGAAATTNELPIYQGGTTQKLTVAQLQTLWDARYNRAIAFQTLTDAASIAWNVTNGVSAQVTLGGNRTLAAPTGLSAGSTYALIVRQDATGGRTLGYNSIFKWPGGVAPVLSTAANAVDVLTFLYDGTSLYGNIAKAFA